MNTYNVIGRCLTNFDVITHFDYDSDKPVIKVGDIIHIGNCIINPFKEEAIAFLKDKTEYKVIDHTLASKSK